MPSALRVDVVTIFPDYLRVLDLSLIGKAAEGGLLDLHVHDLREWTTDRHRTVDDTPLGGGAGMVMKPDVWGAALDDVLTPSGGRQVLVVPTPSGEVFTQRAAEDLAGADQIVFACGRYEGIDARVPAYYASRGVEVRELSIGDYVLNGGEVASLVMIEAIARLRPGVLGNPASVVEESHSSAGLLEQEVYTRPVAWRGMDVATSWPALLSGDHARIARERRDRALARTAARRPDMITVLAPDRLDAADRAALARLGWLTPSAAAHPAPAYLRPALEQDVPALTELAGRTFPDACPPFLTAEQVAAHVRDNLNEGVIASWVSDPRALVSVVVLDDPLTLAAPGGEDVQEHLPAGTLVGYSVVLLDEGGEHPVAGLDRQPRCVRELHAGAAAQPQEPGSPGALVAELSKVYVDARLRGSGAASLLLAEAVCDAATAGVGLMWLGTHERNRRAQKAYKRAGLHRIGTRTYDVGGQRCRDVVMAINPLAQAGS